MVLKPVLEFAEFPSSFSDGELFLSNVDSWYSALLTSGFLMQTWRGLGHLSVVLPMPAKRMAISRPPKFWQICEDTQIISFTISRLRDGMGWVKKNCVIPSLGAPELQPDEWNYLVQESSNPTLHYV